MRGHSAIPSTVSARLMALCIAALPLAAALAMLAVAAGAVGPARAAALAARAREAPVGAAIAAATGSETGPRSAPITADLRVELVSAVTRTWPGGRITLTLGLDNVSATPAETVTASVALGGGLAYVTDTAASAAMSRAFDPVAARAVTAPLRLTWLADRLAGPESRDLQLVVRADPGLEAGSAVTLTAGVATASPDRETDDDRSAVGPIAIAVPDLWIDVADPAPAPAGAEVEHVLTWGSRGPDPAAAVVVTATLPAGLELVSSTPPARVTAPDEGSGPTVLEWRRGAAPVTLDGPLELIRVRGRVDAAAEPGTVLVGSASIAGLGGDRAPSDNSRAMALTVAEPPPRPLADLTLRARLASPMGDVAAGAPVVPGDRVTLSLGVANAGGSPARGVALSVAAPVGVIDLAASGAAGEPLTAVSPPPGSVGPDAWRLPDIEAGKQLTATVSATVARDHAWTGSDLLFWRAGVTSTSPQASVSNTTRTAQMRVSGVDLFVRLALDGGASSLRPGGSLVYDVVFGDRQAARASRRAEITGTLEPGTRFDHWELGLGTDVELEEASTFDADTRQLVWRASGPLPGTASLRLWLTIDDDATPGSAVGYGVAIGSAVGDLNPADNSALHAGARLHGLNLAAEADGPPTVSPGGLSRYTARASNESSLETAEGVTVIAVVDERAELVGVSEPGRKVGERRAEWRFERLDPGARPAVEFDVRADPMARAGAELRHRVEVHSEAVDAVPEDNAAWVTTTVVAGPPHGLSVAAETPLLDACAGEAATLTARPVDRAGNPVADGTRVHWAASAGALSAASSLTARGEAGATLTAGPPTGPVTVVASADDAFAAAEIVFAPGPPKGLTLEPAGPDDSGDPGDPEDPEDPDDPRVVAAGEVIELAAAAVDACGMAAADGLGVRLTAERGTFVGGGRSIELSLRSGTAPAALDVGRTPGPLAVVAELLSPDIELRASLSLLVERRAPSPVGRAWLPLTLVVRGAR